MRGISNPEKYMKCAHLWVECFSLCRLLSFGCSLQNWKRRYVINIHIKTKSKVSDFTLTFSSPELCSPDCWKTHTHTHKNTHKISFKVIETRWHNGSCIKITHRSALDRADQLCFALGVDNRLESTRVCVCVCVFIMEKGRKNTKIEKNEKKKEQKKEEKLNK